MGEARSIQTGHAFVSKAGSHGFYKGRNFLTSCANHRPFKENPAWIWLAALLLGRQGNSG